MGKLYEALRQSQREQEGLDSPNLAPLLKALSLNGFELGAEEEMILLYQNIDSLLSDSPKKVIQFIGPREGGGTSTIVREFARICTTVLCKSVLILDVDQCNSSQRLFFSIPPEYEWENWEDILRDEKSGNKAICQVGESNLFVSPISPNSSLNSQSFYSPAIKSFWKKVKQKFDLILIDSPPAVTTPNILTISHSVDGVILVLEAEKSRWPVAENVKNKILKSGGNILGIVFNKRHYYIPDFIYKRL